MSVQIITDDDDGSEPIIIYTNDDDGTARVTYPADADTYWRRYVYLTDKYGHRRLETEEDCYSDEIEDGDEYVVTIYVGDSAVLIDDPSHLTTTGTRHTINGKYVQINDGDVIEIDADNCLYVWGEVPCE